MSICFGQNVIEHCYNHGLGVVQDCAQAVLSFSLAAAHGACRMCILNKIAIKQRSWLVNDVLAGKCADEAAHHIQHCTSLASTLQPRTACAAPCVACSAPRADAAPVKMRLMMLAQVDMDSSNRSGIPELNHKNKREL